MNLCVHILFQYRSQKKLKTHLRVPQIGGAPAKIAVVGFIIKMAGQSLPSKAEEQKFSQVITCYEKKEYKRGIKLADEILKRAPDHGETEAMKGLIYNCQSDKDQAYHWVKLGLGHNIRSHICWHVYGLIYRSDNNYKEATKCYMNALRINPSNQNIMRDLSFLQVQLRDFDSFVKTRRTILEAKPALRTNWVALAMAHYNAGEFDAAFQVVTKCNEVNLDGADDVSAYDASELLLFQNRCLEKQLLYQEALDHLNEIEPKIVDKLSYHVKVAELLQLLGKYNESKEKWLFLLQDQPENYRFHAGLHAAHLQLDGEQSLNTFALSKMELPSSVFVLTDDQKKSLLEMYQSNETLNQRFAQTVNRKICLSLLSSAEIGASLEIHMKICLRKGIPALYHDICALATMPSYSDPTQQVLCKDPVDFRENSVIKMTMEIISGYAKNLRSANTFDGAASPTWEPPSALLWTMFLQCHLYERCGELDKALLLINECLEHTPTATDLYLKKARVLKKMGLIKQAASEAEFGRSLDLQDRYLNNKATKYALRSNDHSHAWELMAMFARHEGDPQMYLADMQCNWFELEAGETFGRLKMWGPALKKFYSVQKHFVDYVEDMFEFHSFCVRKSMLRVHSDAVAMQNTVYTHPFYQRSARGALKALLHLIDDPEDIDGLGHMTPKERKKEKDRRKKIQARDAKAEDERIAAAIEEAKWMGKDLPQGETKKDADPVGEEYLSKNFLEEAYLWTQKMSSHYSACEPETLSLVVDVLVRRSKPLQAVKVLSAGLKAHPLDHHLSVALVVLYIQMFRKSTKNVKQMSKNQQVMELCKEELKQPWIMGELNLEEYTQAWFDRAMSSDEHNTLDHRMCAAQCVMITAKKFGTEEQGTATVRSLFLDESLWQKRGILVINLERALALIQSFKQDDLAVSFEERIKGSFPLANFGCLTSAEETETELDNNVDEVKEIE